jgi:hypothetical protein
MSARTDLRLDVPEQVHYRQFDDEMLLLDLNRGEYYALNVVGARMWGGLAEGKTPEEIASALAGEYDVEAAVLLRDCLSLVDDLVSRGLLVRRSP